MNKLRFSFSDLVAICTLMMMLAVFFSAETNDRAVAQGLLKIEYPETGPFLGEKVFINLDKSVIWSHEGNIYPVKLYRENGVVMRETTIMAQGWIPYTYSNLARGEEVVYYQKFFPEPECPTCQEI
ncbi:MAG: hypothetical protein WC385_02800 [Candidatus Paceibacterota bacterium]|jgi:hypothetical protein